MVQKRFDERRLADTRLADDPEDAALTATHAFEPVVQPPQFCLSSHEWLPAFEVQGVRRCENWQIASWRSQTIDPFDGRRKAVTDARNGGDKVLAIVAERPAQKRDVARQTCVFDEAVGPHRLEELFLPHDLAGVLYQHEQDLEHLRCERDNCAVPYQQAAVDRKTVSVEHVHVARGIGGHRIGWKERSLL